MFHIYIVKSNNLFQLGEEYLAYSDSGPSHHPPPGSHTAVPENLPHLGNISASAGNWQSVAGTRSKFFVFAAYYERRGQRAVRVIAATKTLGPERVWCRLWFHSATSSQPQSVSVPGKVKVIRENWNLEYSACFVLCPLHGNQLVPASVSVVSRLRVAPSNHLLVHAPSPTANITGQLAVCIKPLHHNYSQTLKLIEFIELNSLLGVSHFFFYNHTCSAEVSCVLADYAARHRITVLPWQLDIASQTEIRTEGIFAALNDCVYRTMYRFSHIALIDLDEFIVPRNSDTLQELIQRLGKQINTRSAGSYSFRNAFFYLQWPDDIQESENVLDTLETNMVTLRKTRRKVQLNPHRQRSKYICRPELVIEAGNHFVWELVPGYNTLNVPPHMAIMHHYRLCESGGNNCINSPSVLDRTLYRYRSRLLMAVGNQWNQSMALCNLPEVTSAPLS
ncbi:hypothetical protein J6590_054032 [Homalodisca vitripennis]|nr:hypothetical protein J6590_054032 [Homalodisca vitripennis]